MERITGSDVFIKSIGKYGKPFQDYIDAVNNIQKLFRSSRQWASENKGSIKQYARYFPDDPYLKEWIKLL
jgi:hypothetical protein